MMVGRVSDVVVQRHSGRPLAGYYAAELTEDVCLRLRMLTPNTVERRSPRARHQSGAGLENARRSNAVIMSMAS